MSTEHLLAYKSAAGRWVLLATVLGSALAAIDGTIVTIALPAIGADLGTSFVGLQWTVTGYTLTLASLILISGAAGDRFGRRRTFLLGVVWFTTASVLCAAAPTTALLIASRILQGIGGALLTPASLAILQSSFAPEDRGQAVGTWAGFSGVAGALAPFIGGWLLALGSWRWVFLVNLPLACVVVAVSLRHMPESADEDTEDRGRLDWSGAALTVVFLGLGTFAIIGKSWLAAGATVVGLAAFVVHERRTATPLLPLGLFRIRRFTAVNTVTFLVYGAIGTFFFLLVLELQVVAGWTPLAAGSATIPVTLITLLLSRSSGALAQRIGPRSQMTIGPLACGAGVMLTLRIDSSTSYMRDVLPAVTLFGVGLATMVAPLTSTALSSVPAHHSGLASGVNNAVARTASLLAIAAIPVMAGLNGDVFTQPDSFDHGFEVATRLCTALFLLGALVAATGIGRSPQSPPGGRPAVQRLNQQRTARS